MSKAATPLSRLVKLYRQALKSRLKIGFEFSQGMIFDPDTMQYRSNHVRHDVRLLAFRSGQYILDNESIETHDIPRHEFWNRLVQYAHSGFGEVRVAR